MGSLLTTLGASPGVNFKGSSLSRYNNSLVGAWDLGDPASSEYAMPAVPGLPCGPFVADGITFGRTGFVGKGTAARFDGTSAFELSPTNRWCPVKDKGFTFSVWIKGTADLTANVGFFGFEALQEASATNRLKIVWITASGSFQVLDVNTFRTVFSVATDWATDIADGNPL